MKVAILGYASQGQSAFAYWNTPDNQITICDSRTDLELPAGVQSHLGPDYLKGLGKFDLIVRGAPSIHPKTIAAANPDTPDILSKVTTVTNEFFRVVSTKNIIGVTGTKGKGTTSTLVSKLLEAAGKRVHLGGNIGIPPLEMLQAGIQADDWVVLELANFQLIDLKVSPPIATCVMVVPEHLDWHEDFNEYVEAKQQLFIHQTANDRAVFNRANQASAKIAGVSPAPKVSYEVPAPNSEPQQKTGVYVSGDDIFVDQTPVAKVSDVALLGRHNLENVCAAIATVWEVIGGQAEIIPGVLRSFKGLEHRLELVRQVDDVAYYDDSFGTTPETALVAIQAFSQPKVIILGGSDKKADFTELAKTVAAGNVRAAVTIGATAPQIEAALRGAGFTNIVPGGTDMPSIVTAAQKQAQPGDVVLLSTGCASFGLFKDYKDRGQQFHAAVTALPVPASVAQ